MLRKRRTPGLQPVIVLILLLLVYLAGCQGVELFDFGDAELDRLELEDDDRLVILAPHPDDEVLGAGGVIQSAVAREIPVYLTFLTFGDYNEWSFALYRGRPDVTPAQVRANALHRGQEAVNAAAIMGVPAEHVTFLGYPDNGTLSIWYRHWGDRPAYRGRLTRSTAVPYQIALRPGAPYRGEEILEDLKTVLLETRPTKIFVSHPADYHPDHQAFYLYLQIALWELREEVTAEVLPYLIHYPGWPQPSSFHPDAPLLPPSPLEETMEWRAFPVAAEERELKLTALQAHETQYAASRRFLRRFIRTNELFGDFPAVDPFGFFPAEISSEDDEYTVQAPGELTDEEEALYVEVEHQSIRFAGNELILTLELSRPLPRGTTGHLYLFGWRHDVAFGEMPKIHIQFTGQGYDVFDQQARLDDRVIDVERDGLRLRLTVPLGVLGEPERLLLGARSRTDTVPLDWVPWRAVEVIPVPSTP